MAYSQAGKTREPSMVLDKQPCVLRTVRSARAITPERQPWKRAQRWGPQAEARPTSVFTGRSGFVRPDVGSRSSFEP